jgi:hypothetical protein
VRLWSLHPRYLDRQGLTAGWREALLAQAVLAGRTKGYTKHPQLRRFQATDDPVAAVGAYLEVLAEEAAGRGYRYDRTRIITRPAAPSAWLGALEVSDGQLEHEWGHLVAKLALRSKGWLVTLRKAAPPDGLGAPLDAVTGALPGEGAPILTVPGVPQPHPIFRVVEGPVADWEVV